jgi:hypothetical protein
VNTACPRQLTRRVIATAFVVAPDLTAPWARDNRDGSIVLDLADPWPGQTGTTFSVFDS